MESITLFDLPNRERPKSVSEMASVTSKSFQPSPVPPSRLNAICDGSIDQIVLKSLASDPERRYKTANEFLADLESWTPRLVPTAALESQSSNSFQTSKEVLGVHSPANEQMARRMAGEAVRLAQEAAKLSEAADLMEEAFNKYPVLRSEYQGRVKLWRRGISM